MIGVHLESDQTRLNQFKPQFNHMLFNWIVFYFL